MNDPGSEFCLETWAKTNLHRKCEREGLTGSRGKGFVWLCSESCRKIKLLQFTCAFASKIDWLKFFLKERKKYERESERVEKEKPSLVQQKLSDELEVIFVNKKPVLVPSFIPNCQNYESCKTFKVLRLCADVFFVNKNKSNFGWPGKESSWQKTSRDDKTLISLIYLPVTKNQILYSNFGTIIQSVGENNSN